MPPKSTDSISMDRASSLSDDKPSNLVVSWGIAWELWVSSNDPSNYAWTYSSSDEGFVWSKTVVCTAVIIYIYIYIYIYTLVQGNNKGAPKTIELWKISKRSTRLAR